jgi:predicted nucleic acid-binding protein
LLSAIRRRAQIWQQFNTCNFCLNSTLKSLLPKAVYCELTDIDPPVPGTSEVQTASWLEVRKVVNREIVERLRDEVKLDPGESEAIALTLELSADLLLIDERRGRAEANRLGLRITGLLGILIEAKH